jgi:nicotinate-nucleotide adenylyltransferase
MRLGVFGGTFDPIHVGHLVLAEQCREQYGLDEVWFVPAAQPPHKNAAAISPAKMRSEMVEFAIAGNAAFRLSTIEMNRVGPSFTVTTLEQLHAEDSSRELFLLIGADSLRDLPLWREPNRILELATIIVVNRGDRPVPDLTGLRAACGVLVDTRIVVANMPALDLSATDIRGRIHGGRSIRYLVPRAVEAYLREHGLYQKNSQAK